ncbi:type II secretion system protein N [Pararobbsia silviterrae]|uniref:General secretion pathway protein GspC n=1 Tax=Pararobbsia silviterrae TaxID=1792498 RepID=A0A494YG63_9BURK|nr:type II secretion system protein N [Pararobbsia silviterrae]RKP59343.1 general secretion pathway protein GspC [Pararobbsia silviterrae]
MNRLYFRLVSLALFAVLCATLTYWAITLTQHPAAPSQAAAAQVEPGVGDAAQLFGSQPTRATQVQLIGVLGLGDHQGAAIVSYNGEPPHAVALGQVVGGGATLSEVRSRSIVIEHNGVKSEITMPANGPGPTIWVR